MRRMLLEGLVGRPLTEKPPAADGAALAELAASLDRAARRRLGRRLAIREVRSRAVCHFIVLSAVPESRCPR